MNDPQEPTHWDLLVSQLGATPPPPEPKKPKDEPQPHEKAVEQGPQGPSSRQEGAQARSKSAPPRPPTDWGRLAEQLGIELPEQPPEPPAKHATSPSSSEPAEADSLALH